MRKLNWPNHRSTTSTLNTCTAQLLLHLILFVAWALNSEYSFQWLHVSDTKKFVKVCHSGRPFSSQNHAVCRADKTQFLSHWNAGIDLYVWTNTVIAIIAVYWYAWPRFDTSPPCAASVVVVFELQSRLNGKGLRTLGADYPDRVITEKSITSGKFARNQISTELTRRSLPVFSRDNLFPGYRRPRCWHGSPVLLLSMFSKIGRCRVVWVDCPTEELEGHILVKWRSGCMEFVLKLARCFF